MVKKIRHINDVTGGILAAVVVSAFFIAIYSLIGASLVEKSSQVHSGVQDTTMTARAK